MTRLDTMPRYGRSNETVGHSSLIYPQKCAMTGQQSLSRFPEKPYALGMEARRADSIAYQEIRNPVSEDFVTLIVVAMLTSMTIVLSLLG